MTWGSLLDPGVKLASREIYVADEVLRRNIERFDCLADKTALYVMRNGNAWHALPTSRWISLSPQETAQTFGKPSIACDAI
jgi:hypothetical protein